MNEKKFHFFYDLLLLVKIFEYCLAKEYQERKKNHSCLFFFDHIAPRATSHFQAMQNANMGHYSLDAALL